jgi:HAD superfamily hydrolase (TIGR01509 family)
MRMLQAVIFDLDGTLIDTETVAIDSGLRAFEALGIQTDAGFLHRLIGRDQPTSHAMIRAEWPDIDLTALVQHWNSGFEARIEVHLPLKPGAAEVLQAIALPKAICTSTSRAGAMRKLALSGLAHHFDLVITRDDVREPKPAPEPYRLAAARLGLPPAACAVFEDSETGAASASSAGCVVVQVPDILPTDGLHANLVAPTLLDGARLLGLIA